MILDRLIKVYTTYVNFFAEKIPHPNRKFTRYTLNLVDLGFHGGMDWGNFLPGK
ncbi:hypothetical protein SPLC1_S030820 [Arthrospira platensis C1]|nr:hypothetical protein SPLC1_S030820 [Arthrospira platensis C1]